MKHLEPDSLDFDDTTQALTIVASAAEHANTTVKKGVTELIIIVLHDDYSDNHNIEFKVLQK